MATAPTDSPAAEKVALPPAVRFVLATMFINSVGFGIVIPVFPQLVMELAHVDIARATAIGGLLSVTFAAFQFFFSPVVGNLSDRFGRRPILLGSLAGFATDFLILAFAPTLAWLFVARALTGIFGATNGPAQSVIADATEPGDRARLYGYISAAFGIGFVAGPAIGGLLGEIDYRLPFYAAAALALANFVYGLIALPETLSSENRRPFEWRRANPVGALLTARKLTGILPLAAVYFLWQLASLIYPLIWSYFAIGRFGWSQLMIGGSLALMGISMALMQTFIAPRIVRRLGERRAAELGLAGASAVMAVIAISDLSWLTFAMMPLIAIQGLVHPCLTAMITRRASRNNQGEVQGFSSSVMAVGSVIAPLLYNPLHAWFTSPGAPIHFHGAVFVVSTGITLVALLVLTRIARAEPPSAQR